MVLVDGRERVPVEVLRDVMKWTEGRFSFQSEPVRPAFQLAKRAGWSRPLAPATSFMALVICRVFLTD